MQPDVGEMSEEQEQDGNGFGTEPELSVTHEAAEELQAEIRATREEISELREEMRELREDVHETSEATSDSESSHSDESGEGGLETEVEE